MITHPRTSNPHHDVHDQRLPLPPRHYPEGSLCSPQTETAVCEVPGSTTGVMAPYFFLPPGREGRPREFDPGLKIVCKHRPTPHLPTHNHSSGMRKTSSLRTFDMSPRLLALGRRAYTILYPGANRTRRYFDRILSDDQPCKTGVERYGNRHRGGNGHTDAVDIPSFEVFPVCIFGPTTAPY